MKAMPSPGELRKQLDQFVKAAGWMLDAMKGLHDMNKMAVFQEPSTDPGSPRHDAFVAQLERVGRNAAVLRNSTLVKPGSKVWDDTKGQSARFARDLIKEFGCDGRPPPLTIGGPYFTLASILYEGGTGKADEDLSQYCRNPDRLGLRYMLGIPDGKAMSGTD